MFKRKRILRITAVILLALGLFGIVRATAYRAGFAEGIATSEQTSAAAAAESSEEAAPPAANARDYARPYHYGPGFFFFGFFGFLFKLWLGFMLFGLMMRFLFFGRMRRHWRRWHRRHDGIPPHKRPFGWGDDDDEFSDKTVTL